MKDISFFFLTLFTVLSLNSFGQVRPDLRTDFTGAQKTTLVNLMQEYIDAEIVDYHCNFTNLSGEEDIHDDFNFMPFHRVYLEGMEDFLIMKGHPEFVPLPSWDPDTGTPSQFRVVDADCFNTNCTINVGNGNPSSYCDDDIDWTPNEDIPNYLQDLCDYDFSPTEPGEEDEDGLSRQLEEPYHNDVHQAMGANMATFASPSSPIFWNWHAYLDDMWKDWECNCSQSTTSDVDLYLKDNTYVMQNYRDRGEEPNIDTGTMSESGDIWVRNQQDGFTNDTHEDPVYENSTTPVYVYVRVRNRGCETSVINEHSISLHWSKGASALTWPSYWNGTTNGYALMGDLISTQNIPTIDAQSSKIMEFQWFPPNPDNYNGNNGEPTSFCLLARQISTVDPMTVTEVADINENIKKNNNIARMDFNIQPNPNPLPIELSSFSGKRIEDEVQLSWQTNSEDQNQGFEIHRSSNDNIWRKIGWVDGNGSSNQQHVYTFDDTKPAYGINYYRLKQIDFDGEFEYSEVIAIENDNSDINIQVFPNPSDSKFNIQIDNPLSQKMKIQINDNLGIKIWESNLMVETSEWRKELNIEKNGVYLISIQLGNKTYYERIVILSKK